jgi:mono/diheme cytochrome c family protein
MNNFIIGVIVGVAGIIAAVFCYFVGGFAPVAVGSGAMPLERYFAKTVMHSAAKQGADVRSPIEPTEANLLAGAHNYRSTCATCHSLPGIGKTDIQKGMYPPPPLLLTGKGVTDDPVGVTHWVIKNGIRMTGMPSFAAAFTDQDLWELSLLLARANQLPASVQELLKKPDSVPVESAEHATAATQQ